MIGENINLLTILCLLKHDGAKLKGAYEVGMYEWGP